MRMLALTLMGGAAVLGAALAVRANRRARPVERVAEGVARLRVPAYLDPWAPASNWLGTVLRFTRTDNSISHMGSSTPYRATLAVYRLEPRQLARLGDDVFRRTRGAHEHVEDERWGAWESRGGWKLRVGEGRYTPNLMNEPSWIAEALDTSRAVMLSYHVWKRHAAREDVVALVDSVLASYEPVGDAASYFGALPRNPTGGLTIALPVELWDPFPWAFDASGVAWLYHRMAREWATDPELPEQAIAVTAFFLPGDEEQAAAARAILAREAGQGLAEAPPPVPAGATEPTVVEVTHVAGSRQEPAWLVTDVDVARGIGVAYRPWRRDADRDAAIAVVERAIASYRYEGDASFFAPKPPDAP